MKISACKIVRGGRSARAAATGSLIMSLFLSLSLSGTAEEKLPPKEKFHLFLLAGQSNMAGRGTITAKDRIPHPRVLMLDRSGKWVPAVEPVHFDKSYAGVGPGRTFGILLAESDPSITVGLIPAACGGSPIASWMPGAFWKQTESHPYDDAISRTRKAMQSGTLKAILWHQGEADCGKTKSLVYHEKLQDLFLRFRRDLGIRGLPVLVGQLSRFPGETWSEGKCRVDSAQEKVVREMPPAAFVTSEGLTSNPDGVHFNADSQRELGRRFFESYRELMKQESR